jgi:hypothetical protein
MKTIKEWDESIDELHNVLIKIWSIGDAPLSEALTFHTLDYYGIFEDHEENEKIIEGWFHELYNRKLDPTIEELTELLDTVFKINV